MAHILLLELPGGNDTDVVETALRLGHELTFVSADLDHYRKNQGVMAQLAGVRELIEVRPFDYAALEARVLAIHAVLPVDAVLCLIDIRMIEASRLAARLALPFLHPDAAALLRDKFSVRRRLQACGIAQPDFRLATTNAELRAAVAEIGLPALIKPADGYGSQNVVVLREEDDLLPWISPLDDFLPQRLDYGLGVQANDRLLVEQFMAGTVLGCDVLSRAGRHQLLGINEKLFFPPPSFAIAGSCFPSSRFESAPIRDYVFAVLDAVGMDWGMSHVELMVTPQGPRLVEVNPRLVGARIPRLLDLALGRSVHADLIALHLGQPIDADYSPLCCSVSRWFAADRSGILERLRLPARRDPRIRHVEIVKGEATRVGAPFNNGDRLGYVMAAAGDRQGAEAAAEAFIREIEMEIRSC